MNAIQGGQEKLLLKQWIILLSTVFSLNHLVQ